MMKAIDLIRWALQMTEEGTNALVKDMRDAALTQPTDRGGNHTLWALGHMAWVEAAVRQIVSGEPNPLERWKPLFQTGSEAKPDASLYPSFDEVLAAYRDGRARTLKLLDELGEAGLDREPRNVPPGFEEGMKTFGRALMLITLHQMVHYGQIADARRVAGRKPLH
jgi:uncharacterized damage-inducible protein DinB